MSRGKNSFLGKFLKGAAITLLIITILLTVVGAAGTFCVAFRAEEFKNMIALVPYKWLYKIFMGISLAAGIWGIFSAAALIKGKVNAMRNTFIFLIIGAVSAASQMATSVFLYGNAKPINIRVYVTVFTLIFFFLLKLPPVKDIVDFKQSAKSSSSGGLATGIAMIICGIITLATKLWVGFSHVTSEGTNWVDVLDIPLKISGFGMMVAGIAWILFKTGILNKKKFLRGFNFNFNRLDLIHTQRVKIKNKNKTT